MDKVGEIGQLCITGECVCRIYERIVGVNVVEEGGDVVINVDRLSSQVTHHIPLRELVLRTISVYKLSPTYCTLLYSAVFR